MCVQPYLNTKWSYWGHGGGTLHCQALGDECGHDFLNCLCNSHNFIHTNILNKPTYNYVVFLFSMQIFSKKMNVVSTHHYWYYSKDVTSQHQHLWSLCSQCSQQSRLDPWRILDVIKHPVHCQCPLISNTNQSPLASFSPGLIRWLLKEPDEFLNNTDTPLNLYLPQNLLHHASLKAVILLKDQQTDNWQYK